MPKFPSHGGTDTTKKQGRNADLVFGQPNNRFSLEGKNGLDGGTEISVSYCKHLFGFFKKKTA